MSIQRTLSIVKPDAVRRNYIGEIYTRIEGAGLRIVAAKMMQLTEQQAQDFYKDHQARPFFDSLVAFMTSGPVMVQVLEGEEAISVYRDLMGDTDPQAAKQSGKKTIRGDLAHSIEANAVHGSDSLEAARREIQFFFPGEEAV